MEKTPPYLPLTLVLTSLFSISLFHFMAYQTDTPSFVNAVQILLQESSEEDRLSRLSKPLVLLLPLLLYKIGISIAYGLFVQQLIAHLLGSWLLYLVLKQLLSSAHLAYLGMLAYVLCQPVSVYGLAMLTDGVGWCWVIASIWISLLLFDNKITPNYKQLIGLGVFLGLGFFVKESILIAGLFLFFLIITNSQYSWLQKVKFYLLIGLSFITIVVVGNYFIYCIWNESIIEWMAFGHSDPPPFQLHTFALQSYHTFDVYWFFILLGIGSFVITKNKNKALIAVLLTTIFSWILLPIAWPYLYDRILFLIAPFMMVWVAMGAAHFGKAALGLVLFGGLMNVLVSFGIYKYQMSGLMVLEMVLFGLSLGWWWWMKKASAGC